MPAELHSSSPTGRHQVLVNPWEARNSLWVESPELYDSIANELVLRFSSELWSLDHAEWKSETVVDLLLRKYPGNHLPAQLRVSIDCERKLGMLESGTAVPLEQVEAALERCLTWRQTTFHPSGLLFGSGSGSIVSRITSIVIKGSVFGTPVTVSTTDSFRFMAQKIGTFKVGGVAFPLTAGANNFLVGSTGDTRIFDAT